MNAMFERSAGWSMRAEMRGNSMDVANRLPLRPSDGGKGRGEVGMPGPDERERAGYLLGSSPLTLALSPLRGEGSASRTPSCEHILPPREVLDTSNPHALP